jgi:hypothetical protein
METEINQNSIIAHVAGLTDHTKVEFYNLFKKSQLAKFIDIIDVDIITTKIIEDNIMETLFAKFEYYSERSKSQDLTQAENKTALAKAKQLEKKMFQYWKVRMEYYINKLSSTSHKKIILIGYLSFFKNHRIYLNLNITTKFFLKVNYAEHAKSIIKHNLENSKNDIIDGNFDLNYLNPDFLIKKRTQLQIIYSKIGYIIMGMSSIINTIELFSQTKIPESLFYASFTKYDKKIPNMTNIIHAYSEEWIALASILSTSELINSKDDDKSNTNVEKGVNKSGKPYIKINKEQSKRLNKKGYIYEITTTDNFLPFPTKNNVYKYFTVKPIKINRILEIDNIISQLKKMNIIVEVI